MRLKIICVFWFQPEYLLDILPARIQVFPGRLTGTAGFGCQNWWKELSSDTNIITENTGCKYYLQFF
jgi:hypothetical protein